MFATEILSKRTEIPTHPPMKCSPGTQTLSDGAAHHRPDARLPSDSQQSDCCPARTRQQAGPLGGGTFRRRRAGLPAGRVPKEGSRRRRRSRSAADRLPPPAASAERGRPSVAAGAPERGSPRRVPGELGHRRF